MIAVMQTKFGPVEGNCFSACIASILEIPLDDIPADLITRTHWFRAINEWLRDSGRPWRMVCSREWLGASLQLDGVYSIAAGCSTRGILHAVVQLGEEMVHDPHPDGTGIASVESRFLFVATNPAAGGKG